MKFIKLELCPWREATVRCLNGHTYICQDTMHFDSRKLKTVGDTTVAVAKHE
jgi:hypothetical protein